MANPIFEAFAKLTLETKDFDQKLDEEGENTKKFGEKLLNVLGGVGAAVGSATVAAVGAAASAVVDITKQAVASYAEYEQLVGGVETIFKDSADKVKEYASEAYKNAGVSANEYMDTVTSFSASLIQGLEGDTSKAAEYANRAIVDMSDNANKMGTSMESIQNAYNGFAKQNYTMLDNLKLGYGGTREEMVRLIEHAASLTDVQKELNVTVDAGSMSFDNIINAISVVQKELGITGTTAEEASSTIEGSMNMLKGAWKDLLTSLAGGGVELSTAIDNLMSSAEALITNLIPVVEKTLYGIGSLIQGVAPMIAKRLPELISTLVPMLMDTAISIVDALVENLPMLVQSIADAVISILPQLVETAVNLLDSLMNDILPTLFEVAIELVLALGEGIADNAEKIISSIVTLIIFITKTVIENLPKIIDVGLKIILAIIMGILDNIDKIGQAIGEMIPMIVLAIAEALPTFIELGGKIILALIVGIVSAIPRLLIAVGEGLGLVKKKVKDDTEDMGNDVTNSELLIGNKLKDLQNELGTAKSNVQTQTDQIQNITKESVDSSQQNASKIVALAKVTKEQISQVSGGLGSLFDGILKDTNEFVIKFMEIIDKAIVKLKELGDFVAEPSVDASAVVEGCDEIVQACNKAIHALNSLAGAQSGGSFGGGRASGGWMNAGSTYLVGEMGPELITADRTMYVHNSQETSRMMNGGSGVVININGDVYDDQYSMRKKIKGAVMSVLQEQVAYG